MTLVLGITGAIASGKSSAAAGFVELGAAAVSADQLAREVVAPGSATLAALVAAFGPGILTAEGGLDRETMAHRVFAEPAARERLNAITHPAIARLSVERLGALRANRVPLVVYEAPLLFEAGAERRVDRVLVLTVDPAVQRARLRARDGLSQEEIDGRVAAQWPQWQKVARADFVIDNSGSMEQLRARITELHRYLLSASPR